MQAGLRNLNYAPCRQKALHLAEEPACRCLAGEFGQPLLHPGCRVRDPVIAEFFLHPVAIDHGFEPVLQVPDIPNIAMLQRLTRREGADA